MKEEVWKKKERWGVMPGVLCGLVLGLTLPHPEKKSDVV